MKDTEDLPDIMVEDRVLNPVCIVFDREAKAPLIKLYEYEQVDDSDDDEPPDLIETRSIKVLPGFSEHCERLALNNRCIYKFKSGNFAFALEFIHKKGCKEGDNFMNEIRSLEPKEEYVQVV